jgi:hypothetical protein
MGLNLLSECIRQHYEVHEWKHACAILQADFPSEWQDITLMLETFRPASMVAVARDVRCWYSESPGRSMMKVHE